MIGLVESPVRTRAEGIFKVKSSARGTRVAVSADGRGLVSQAGAVLLWETMRVTGLGRGLSDGLARWRAPRAVHDPGKVIADLAAAVALGGDCLADIAVLREQPELAGPVASDPAVSRLVAGLAADGPRALKALNYSVGMTITGDIQDAIGKVPAAAWTPACDGDGEVREGAWVADVTGLLNLDEWPAGMRVIVRKERPHPGAQPRFTDIDGHRFTCFATDAKKGQLADLELRHRRRARCEDRIRCAKDTGLRNLPLKGFAQNQLWCEIVSLACELLAWTQLLTLTGKARRWEPKRLRLRVLAVAGRLVRGGRRLRLRLSDRWP
jgi:Transposase DDE domain group 1